MVLSIGFRFLSIGFSTLIIATRFHLNASSWKNMGDLSSPYSSLPSLNSYTVSYVDFLKKIIFYDYYSYWPVILLFYWKYWLMSILWPHHYSYIIMKWLNRQTSIPYNRKMYNFQNTFSKFTRLEKVHCKFSNFNYNFLPPKLLIETCLDISCICQKCVHISKVRLICLSSFSLHNDFRQFSNFYLLAVVLSTFHNAYWN